MEDPRLAATRSVAMEAARKVLLEDGVLAVTHASVSKLTGVSRSTLYRHWPDVDSLRNEVFKHASRPAKIAPKTNGPLRTDLVWLLSFLINALNESHWKQIAPQVIAAAATNDEARSVINDFMKDRIEGVEAIFEAARKRGEIGDDAPVRHLVEMAVAVPYFRKLIAGLPLDPAWFESHIDLICSIATQPPQR